MRLGPVAWMLAAALATGACAPVVATSPPPVTASRSLRDLLTARPSGVTVDASAPRAPFRGVHRHYDCPCRPFKRFVVDGVTLSLEEYLAAGIEPEEITALMIVSGDVLVIGTRPR